MDGVEKEPVHGARVAVHHVLTENLRGDDDVIAAPLGAVSTVRVTVDEGDAFWGQWPSTGGAKRPPFEGNGGGKPL